MGRLSSIVFTLCWLSSASIYGEWKLGSDSLSSLGVCGDMTAEMIFNIGCAITGILVVFLGLALIGDHNVWIRSGGITTLFCGVACLAIGIINEGYGDIHMHIATAYGMSAAVTIALTGAGDYIEDRKPFTALALILLLICGYACAFQPFGIFEPVAIACILIWTFVQSAIMMEK